MNGITFDAGGLIALDRNDRRVIVLLARATDLGIRVIVPPAGTDLVPLNGSDATAVGLLLAETATVDIVDAHVVVCARRSGQVVVTSDPGDIKRIDPEPRLVAV
jgi:hypothetical protein